ncbi:DUF4437 domain-containing protein [Rheinheimera sp. UJ51]|uniref:DUF4437 domain-containing protein n=1 Tax=Rheinheimera sp. UJ51 TaxID=2892446 RepID=UPI001E3BBB8E|nr:DUF4437 domain-containing protein [Rheinheimera sp. UJ51]MCC5450428.1 DUF4437 domain-containing protein [Rheinheimera sp. UJ51]
MLKLPLLLCSSLILSHLCWGLNAKTTVANIDVVAVEDISWGYLNPARAAKGPSAADLWGDRTQNTPSGILLKFPAGFSSPPHIHNISYRGVVIKGQLHNDDPSAATMWLPAGAYWTQPAGEAHITAANQQINMAYIEINSGPYLVQPTTLAFDNGERPINVDPSNLVWLDATESSRLSGTPAKMAYLWEENTASEAHGRLLKLPANFSGNIKTQAASFKAVVIAGSVQLTAPTATKALLPGSYFGTDSAQTFAINGHPTEQTLLYINAEQPYQVAIN